MFYLPCPLQYLCNFCKYKEKSMYEKEVLSFRTANIAILVFFPSRSFFRIFNVMDNFSIMVAYLYLRTIVADRRMDIKLVMLSLR